MRREHQSQSQTPGRHIDNSGNVNLCLLLGNDDTARRPLDEAEPLPTAEREGLSHQDVDYLRKTQLMKLLLVVHHCG